MTDDLFKWKCLTYCLTCLQVTSTSLSKYLQNKKHIKNALHEKEIADLFWGIFQKVIHECECKCVDKEECEAGESGSCE